MHQPLPHRLHATRTRQAIVVTAVMTRAPHSRLLAHADHQAFSATTTRTTARAGAQLRTLFLTGRSHPSTCSFVCASQREVKYADATSQPQQSCSNQAPAAHTVHPAIAVPSPCVPPQRLHATRSGYMYERTHTLRSQGPTQTRWREPTLQPVQKERVGLAHT